MDTNHLDGIVETWLLYTYNRGLFTLSQVSEISGQNSKPQSRHWVVGTAE